MNNLLASLPAILSRVNTWVEQQEATILETGVGLSEEQLADARAAGVTHPEKIRVLLAEKLPEIENEDLMFLARQVGLFSERSVGLNFGYAICLPPGLWHDRATLVHECVHVGQHERLQGIRPFLAAYVRECLDPGYPFGHLEQEAIRVTKVVCKPVEPEQVHSTS